ncbi:hypothetical protein Patl1_25449 [Pistacia atlantica]|uniref:Uncharacterized protein n=1 Tax=Pistacia atlantica TaxID=434234 RepID=A0ACC1B372_9ROSI|nr:hypothetical protein Patl1_25449 [Pistacia atlantica]
MMVGAGGGRRLLMLVVEDGRPRWWWYRIHGSLEGTDVAIGHVSSTHLKQLKEIGVEEFFLTVMDQIDDPFRNQIAKLLRVLNLTTCLKEDKIPCEIEPGLFLGSIGAASNKDALKSRNITHILTVANSLSPAHPHDFVYKVVGVSDKEDTNLSQYFDECIDFIDEAKRKGGGVLVHCFVGRSRSVTIVVAYLVKKHGMSLSQALEHVKSRRPQAAPNAGFILQLQEFEKCLQGNISLN